MHYITRRTSKDSKLPTFLVLHGYGADERDLLPIAEQVAPDFLTISLRAPIELMQGGYAWYHLKQTETGLHPDDLSRHESEDLLMTSLASIVEREGGDPKRIVLMGFSQGAAVIYSTLITYNWSNYGLMPIASINMSGYLPRDILAPLGEKDFSGFPFFLSHGEYDDLIPSAALPEAERLLSNRGAAVTARMYPVGHGVLPETIEDIAKWFSALGIDGKES